MTNMTTEALQSRLNSFHLPVPGRPGQQQPYTQWLDAQGRPVRASDRIRLAHPTLRGDQPEPPFCPPRGMSASPRDHLPG